MALQINLQMKEKQGGFLAPLNAEPAAAQPPPAYSPGAATAPAAVVPESYKTEETSIISDFKTFYSRTQGLNRQAEALIAFLKGLEETFTGKYPGKAEWDANIQNVRTTMEDLEKQAMVRESKLFEHMLFIVRQGRTFAGKPSNIGELEQPQRFKWLLANFERVGLPVTDTQVYAVRLNLSQLHDSDKTKLKPEIVLMMSSIQKALKKLKEFQVAEAGPKPSIKNCWTEKKPKIFKLADDKQIKESIKQIENNIDTKNFKAGDVKVEFAGNGTSTVSVSGGSDQQF